MFSPADVMIAVGVPNVFAATSYVADMMLPPKTWLSSLRLVPSHTPTCCG